MQNVPNLLSKWNKLNCIIYIIQTQLVQWIWITQDIKLENMSGKIKQEFLNYKLHMKEVVRTRTVELRDRHKLISMDPNLEQIW